MADEEAAPQTEAGAQRTVDGRLAQDEPTPQPLKLKLHEDFDSEKKPVNESTAIMLLTARLRRGITQDGNIRKRMNANFQDGSDWTSGSFAGVAEMARKLYSVLPPEMLTQEVLENGDMRPMLDLLAIQEDEIDEADNEPTSGVRFTDAERYFAQLYSTAESKILRDELVKTLTDSGMNPTEIPAYAEELVYGYKDGTVRRLEVGSNLRPKLPIDETDIFANSDTGETQLRGESAQSLDNTGFNPVTSSDQTASSYQLLTQREWQQLLRDSPDGGDVIDRMTNEYARTRTGSYTDDAGNRGEVRGKQFDGIYYERPEMTERTYGLAPGLNGQASDQGGRGPITRQVREPGYNIRQARDLPSTMTPGEIRILSGKMLKAGYLASEMSDPSNRADPKFKAAWTALLAQSMELDEPIVDLLDRQIDEYQKTIDKSLATSLTDPARIRMNVDSIGRQLLGRKLRPDEHEQMIAYVRELEIRNAKIAAGFDPDSTDGLEDLEGERIMADVDARLQDKIRSENNVEGSAHEVSDQYDVFTSLLAGPGRGY